MSSKRPLHIISAPSTSFTTGAYWDGRGAYPAIRFGYPKDGSEIQGGIKFGKMCAMRERAERCCTEWHIRDAYDTLVEVEDSDWVKEVRADMDERWRNKWEMHHYLIYLDGRCFEVIADSWATL